MAIKVFREHGNLQLISDERDVLVPSQLRSAVLAWCLDNDILAEFDFASGWELAESTWAVNLWRVRDEQQRVAFLLKWSSHA